MTLRALLRILSLLLLLPVAVSAQPNRKPRVLILSDIEADPDDTQSFVRLLLYSNQWDIEGLIATTSIHQQQRVAPESIVKVLDAYKKIQPNLLKHEQGYPAYETLRSKVKTGLAVYGMQGVGEGKDSEGSDWIVQLLQKKDDRPLWVCVWGGPNTLAQALWKVQHTMNAEAAAKIYQKLRVYTISDQDDSGPWLRNTFPSLFFVVTPGYAYSKATWIGIMGAMPGSNTEVVSNEWLAKNIQQGHGPLGAIYPDVAYGMEGDTPSFLSLINNGLNDPEHPNYGGWGGRYEYYLPALEQSNNGMFSRPDWPKDLAETRPIWTNANDSVVSPIDKKTYYGNRETIWRWRVEFQNDFAARMQWTTKTYKECNHPPVIKLAHSKRLRLKSGQSIRLSASGTTDPDGDSMSYLWFPYREAGTYKGPLRFPIAAGNMYEVPFVAPAVDSEQTIHMILKVTDKGSPALTRYQRVIITVEP
jgi:hypothetical protein